MKKAAELAVIKNLAPVICIKNHDALISCGTSWLTINLAGRVQLRLGGREQLGQMLCFLQRNLESRDHSQMATAVNSATFRLPGGQTRRLYLEQGSNMHQSASFTVDQTTRTFSLIQFDDLLDWLLLILDGSTGRRDELEGDTLHFVRHDGALLCTGKAPGGVVVSFRMTLERAADLQRELLACAGAQTAYNKRLIIGRDKCLELSAYEGAPRANLVCEIDERNVLEVDLERHELVLLAARLKVALGGESGK